MVKWILCLLVILVIWIMWPVCLPIEDLSGMTTPIEERTDQDFYLKIFQKSNDGSWSHCKTRLSRFFFA
jgi:hypothetical protein